MNLGRAVVERAFADLEEAAKKRTGRRYGAVITGKEISGAWLFLTAQEGEWKLSREYWTQLAGMDAEEVRERALKMLSVSQPAADVKCETEGGNDYD